MSSSSPDAAFRVAPRWLVIAVLSIGCGGAQAVATSAAPSCATLTASTCADAETCRAEMRGLDPAMERAARARLSEILATAEQVDLDTLAREAVPLLDADSDDWCTNDRPRLASILRDVAQVFHAGAQDDAGADAAPAETALAFYGAALLHEPTGSAAAELGFLRAQLLTYRLGRPLEAARGFLDAVRADPHGAHALDITGEALVTVRVAAAACSETGTCPAVALLVDSTTDLWLEVSAGADQRAEGILEAIAAALLVGREELAMNLAERLATEEPGSRYVGLAAEMLADQPDRDE